MVSSPASRVPRPGVLLLSSRGPHEVAILRRADRHGTHPPLPLLRDAVIFTRTISPQLSVCQLGAAITVAVQTKHATLLTRVLGTEVSLITIGVSVFSKYHEPIHFRTVPNHLSFLLFRSSQIWGASGLLCDVMIAGIMTYYVRTFHRHSVPNWPAGADPTHRSSKS